MEILLFLNLVFFIVCFPGFFSSFFCLYVCYIIVDFYFYSYFLFFSFCTINLTITIFSSLLSPPSLSLLLCYIHCSPSQLLFLPLLIHYLSLLLPPPLILLQPVTTLPLLLHTHRLLANLCTNFTQSQPPAILDTSTLHYNRSTPKHTQGPKNPAAPTPLPPLTHPTSHLPF
jgi:hypothetical protein